MNNILESYRFRIPASLALAVLISTLSLSLVIAYQTYVNVGAQQKREGIRLAHAMSPLLARALKHDDVWLAFSVLRGPDEGNIPAANRENRSLIVVDNALQIFASNQPRLFPINQSLDAIYPGIRQTIESMQAGSRLFSYQGNKFLLQVIKSVDEGDQVGLLLQEVPKYELWARISEILTGGALTIILILLVLIGIGWFWGSRIVNPILMLASCMQRVSRDDISEIQCPTLHGNNEISQLGRAFYHLLADLKTKKALEARIMTQERLAAIGQVAAGVAHEINNPLGGLITSIDTYHQTPVEQRRPEKTLNFISRGLEQIRESVGALLVESKLETRALTPQDIDDIEKLARSNAEQNGKRVQWENHIRENLSLPATPVRQVLLNLLLNAVQATADPQEIEVKTYLESAELVIEVCNKSEPLESRALAQMFEPFKSGHAGGTGLGLWISYQTVSQLNGSINVDQIEGKICFLVKLPLGADKRGQV